MIVTLLIKYTPPLAVCLRETDGSEEEKGEKMKTRGKRPQPRLWDGMSLKTGMILSVERGRFQVWFNGSEWELRDLSLRKVALMCDESEFRTRINSYLGPKIRLERHG